MSSNTNSIPPFVRGKLKDALEALGITQFPSETNWYQVIGGLIVQGGLVEVPASATTNVPFNAPYEKQVLGVWIQVIGSAPNNGYVNGIPPLDSFDIVNGIGDRDYYWLSLGV